MLLYYTCIGPGTGLNTILDQMEVLEDERDCEDWDKKECKIAPGLASQRQFEETLKA